ncbi:MAG: hypothetical protein COB83_12415 [Gammaproteobacteria bacterium]|nr:MAG: hypothetical protein COB83_12415 [Gammaproteobacteria bacterium]
MSGLDVCKSKIKKFSRNDLEGQIKLINLSLSKYSSTFFKPDFSPISIFANDIDFFLQSSKKVGDLIIDQKLAHLGSSLYPCAIKDSNNSSCINVENRTFFDGSIGICVFLAHLYEVFPNNKRTTELKNDIKQIVDSEIHCSTSKIGGIEGIAGALYALSIISRLWPDDYWIKELAESCVYIIELQTETIDKLDIMSGLSGNLISLIAIYESIKIDSALTIAKKTVLKIQNGIDGTKDFCEQNIGRYGLAHGPEGVCFAIDRFNKLTLEQCDESVINDENTLLSSLIKKDNSNGLMLAAWCNGQVGVKLAESFLNKNFDTSQSNLTETALLNSTITEYGLCHGVFGNLEYIFSLIQGESSDDKFATLIDSYLQKLSISGLSYQANKKLPILGLMNGWAGIGYQLLRFALPQKVPCLLNFSTIPLTDLTG